jgi:hypothetical protein
VVVVVVVVAAATVVVVVVVLETDMSIAIMMIIIIMQREKAQNINYTAVQERTSGPIYAVFHITVKVTSAYMLISTY